MILTSRNDLFLSRRGISASAIRTAPICIDPAAELAEVDSVVQRVRNAQVIYASFDQAAVDKIVETAAQASIEAIIPLAQLAYEETGRGIFEDKVIKNHFSAENVRIMRSRTERLRFV